MNIAQYITHMETYETYFLFKTNGPDIKLFFMTDNIIRMRASFDKVFEESSYTLALTAWNDRLDHFAKHFRKRISPISVSVQENETSYIFLTKTWKLVLSKNPFGVQIFTLSGEKLYSDLHGRALKKDNHGRIYHYSEMEETDYFYGFGETPGPINKKGKRIRLAPKDAIGYDAEGNTPLYKHIPFYIRMNCILKHALGLFYHNTYESIFDLGCERSGYWPRYNYFCSDGGDIDLFFINGPNIAEVVERYTDLTGKTAFAPMYSLGYLGSAMYYVELKKKCDDEIIHFIEKNRKEGIPIDNFHLSSGYTADPDSNKRNIFTWSKVRFPHPKKFFSRMAEHGVTITPNVKPGVLLSHPQYDIFASKNMFIQDSQTKKPYIGRWWGGQGSFIDFTNPETRVMWKKLIKDHLINMGAISLWNDNCEYDSIEDNEALCSFDGLFTKIEGLKSTQSLIMAHVASEVFHEQIPNIRPFILNRSGYAGIQKYASTWCGDNYTSWSTLKYNIATILGMSLSGVANNGGDIGGFAGSRPDAELLVRWIQNGIFQPRFSIHSCNNDNTVTQPWMYGKYTHIIRHAILFRYELLPYLYSLLYQAHYRGYPIIRPLFYEFQDDTNTYDEGSHFMCGPSLLIANVLEKGRRKKIYLPKGSNWYYWYDRKKYMGGQSIEIDVDIETIPLFIRSNSITVMTKNFTSINKETFSHFYIIIGGEKSYFTLFEDDKISYKYLEGKYLETKITAIPGEKFLIHFEKQGTFVSPVKTMVLDIIHKEKGPYWVSVDGENIEGFINRDRWELASKGWYYSVSKGSVLIKYPNRKHSYQVIVSFEHFDMIGI